MRPGITSNKYPLILLIIVVLFWIWSGINPHDTRLTWVLETFPVMIALPIMLITYRRFRLTGLTYTLIAIHAIILMLGGGITPMPKYHWVFGWKTGLAGHEMTMIRSDI